MTALMRQAVPLLRTFLVLLAWFAQWCLPLAHAAAMAAPAGPMAGWCGQPSSSPAFQAYLAELPDELRRGLDEPGASDHALAACAQLCAVATTPPPLAGPSPTVVLRAAHLEPAPIVPPLPPALEPKRRPPAQGPPTRG